MNTSIQNHLRRLREASWFRSVGVGPTTHILLSSWPDAIQHAGGDNWEAIQTDAFNDIWLRIDRHDQSWAKQWNDLVATVDAPAKKVVNAQVQGYPALAGSKDAVLSLTKIVRMSCMELEYAAVGLPKFFLGLADILSGGHFPCGYNGEYPDGQVVIY